MRFHLSNSGLLPIGVDFGTGSVRLLQLRRRRGRHELVSAAQILLDASAAALSPEARLGALVEALHKRLDGAGFQGSRCVIGLDDSLIRVKSVRQPVMPRDEADKAVRLEAKDRLGFEQRAETEVAWLRAGEVRQGDDVRDELILVGAPRAPLERLVDGVAAIGLRPIAVEPGFVSCCRAFTRGLRRAADADLVRFIMDVGWRGTNMLIQRGGDVAFFKRVELGGARLTEIAADRLRLDPGTVAELRLNRMRRGPDDTAARDERVDRAIFTAIRPLLGELAREAQMCMRYYSVSFAGQRPEKALIVGGQAAEPGLVEAVHEALHIPTEVGKPLDGIGLEGAPPVIDRRGLLAEWAVAAGLSLRGDAVVCAGPPPGGSTERKGENASKQRGVSPASPNARPGRKEAA